LTNHHFGSSVELIHRTTQNRYHGAEKNTLDLTSKITVLPSYRHGFKNTVINLLICKPLNDENSV